MSKGHTKVKFGLHKLLFIMTFALICLNICGMKCNAEEKNTIDEVDAKIEKILKDFENAIPEEYGEIADINDAAEAVSVKRIFEGIIDAIRGKSGELTALLLLLLGIALISTLASLINSELGTVSSRAVGVVASAILFERLVVLVVGAVRSLDEVSGFFEAVIPISLAVNSLGASPTTASTQALGMGLTLGIYTFIAKKLVLPVVIAIFVTSAASSIDPFFGRISKVIKGILLWIMGILTALVGATFSLQSVIAVSADSAAIRSARYAITGTIPIVGNALSGALSVVAGGVSYARGLVGGGAVAVILVLVLSPLVTLLIYRTCLKAGVFFSSVSSLDGCSEILSSFIGAFDALIAAYALTSTVYISELIAFLKGGASFA